MESEGAVMGIRDLVIPAEAVAAVHDPDYRVITVCAGTGCTSSASAEVRDALDQELVKHGLGGQVEVRRTGCFGFCAMGPIMVVNPGETFYTQVAPEDVPEIVAEHVVGGRAVKRLLYQDPAHKAPVEKWSQIDFYGKQKRILLGNCGIIDPENIDHYLARDGYRALHTVFSSLTPEQVIQTVVDSGLRGRGGGGFSTGTKWKLARQTQRWPKYVICNADEGDPGAFMDRSTLEGDPHALIEGMIIAGYAIGAESGYIYCRAEYPLAIRRLEIALAQARERGLLGANILGSDFSFDLYVKEGAGAFVCGEETALMASIQGDRGQPWPRPPYPAVSGLWGQPSNVNNVKSYAYVPAILRHGPQWFKDLGTQGSPGTAVFALSGMVNATGLIEVPMGLTLGEIIYEIGGGVPDGRKFKAVQTGGPLGGCLPEAYLDTPVDFDSLRAAGAVMGSGGMIVADETTCMVEFSKYFMKFVCDESCGKCPPCRIGSTRMLEVLERITSGQGELADLDRIREIADGMQKGSLCALGQLAPSPVLSALRHFEEEFLAHIKEARCPAASCQMLVRSRCVSACPAGVDVPAYLSLIAQGRYAEALDVHRDANPFALICGRVLPGVLREALPPRGHRRADHHPPGQTLHGRQAVRRTVAPAQDGAAEARQGGGDRRGPVRADGRAPADPARLRRHRVGADAAARRHDDLRHPGLPPAAGGALRRDRAHLARGRDVPAEHGAGQRLHHQEPEERGLRGGRVGAGRAPQPQPGRQGRGQEGRLPRRPDAARHRQRRSARPEGQADRGGGRRRHRDGRGPVVVAPGRGRGACGLPPRAGRHAGDA